MLTIDNACNTSKMKLQSGTLLHDLLMLRHGQITKPSDLFSPRRGLYNRRTFRSHL